MKLPYLSLSSRECLSRLESFVPAVTSIETCVRASVLVLLFADEEGELRVVLTTRSKNLRSHSGDVSLPGGKADGGEGVWSTARREAFEEIGLPVSIGAPLHIEQLTTLAPHLSRTHIVVTPCIAYLSSILSDGVIRVLDPKEVGDIFTVPFEMFLSKRGYRGGWISWFDKKWAMHEFYPEASQVQVVEQNSESGERKIWGLTARILVEAARV
ncbi:Nudix hydrolase 15, mitochondrial, partial [Neolecta irregularis DAH-3]